MLALTQFYRYRIFNEYAMVDGILQYVMEVQNWEIHLLFFNFYCRISKIWPQVRWLSSLEDKYCKIFEKDADPISCKRNKSCKISQDKRSSC